MITQKGSVHKKQLILISLCIIMITICAVVLSCFHYHIIEEQHHITHIKMSKQLTNIRHQDKNFLTSIDYDKRNNTVYWHLNHHAYTNINRSYPLYLRNILLNREAKFNQHPAITNNFSITQSQILSHLNDSLATINYQSTLLNHIHKVYTVTNNHKANKALFINKHINTQHYVTLNKKKRAKKALSAILDYSLFTKHIKISKSSDLLFISVPKSIKRRALSKQNNSGYALRVRIYQTILQDTYIIQNKIHNPFIAIRVINTEPLH